MKLLEKVTIGNKTLNNAIAMAPMTRSRADAEGVVSDLTLLYYTQRASAGLIITEAVNISAQALGSPLTPGLYTKEQINAWKKVTKSVHDDGGAIYAQLWHTGRVGHSVDRNGKLPVAPSAVGIKGQQHFTSQGMKDYETPQELTIADIKQIVKDYGQAARNALEAGFDGVELHAAFGYLPNQFLSESANHRTDEYGGSIENRNRFVLQVMQELVNVCGNDKVGIKLSPTVYYNNIENSDPVAQFKPLIEALNDLPLAYIHLMNGVLPLNNHPHYPENAVETFGSISKHLVIANAGFDKDSGEAELKKGIAQIISYGSLFIANPDLPKRFELDAAFNTLDHSTMYGGGEKGYTDYPFLKA
ncbi:alkene reductase [Mucilaginibacter phyllosphaerae]|uniref:Alkene reductase n=1 Tax=Mucilaginibacter phyllosphaerae TaxID=1812349 RepID=A0A4Y8AD95_9SPHI|nr:alkene reductase [Mucilaginibacter phyllosphaerae]MBB3969227.1 N-ethylmaleimide reductase [Mucilaginibacter phyllosphaerae]TEW65972.1 alkene reductase [Mucilaginibacter phyllosphaerae]GGH07109.1 alkene reductase [Mucilaginibacter phyllosphaerae]